MDPNTGRYYGGRQDRKDSAKRDRRLHDKVSEREEPRPPKTQRHKKKSKDFRIQYRYIGTEIEFKNPRSWLKFEDQHPREWTNSWGKYGKLKDAIKALQHNLPYFWDTDPEDWELRIINTKTGETVG